MKREIEAPDKEWSNLKEAAAYLHVTAAAFRQLVKAGFVIERKLNNQNRVYHWEALVAAHLRLKLGDLPKIADEKGDEED